MPGRPRLPPSAPFRFAQSGNTRCLLSTDTNLPCHLFVIAAQQSHPLIDEFPPFFWPPPHDQEARLVLIQPLQVPCKTDTYESISSKEGQRGKTKVEQSRKRLSFLKEKFRFALLLLSARHSFSFYVSLGLRAQRKRFSFVYQWGQGPRESGYLLY